MNAPRGSGLGRRSRNTVTTKSGKTLKINRSLSDRIKSNKMARQTEKAAYLSTLPKNRFLRVLYRLHPKRVAQYWFSREGGIMALKIVGICIVASFFLTIGMFAYFRKDLPKIKDISGGSLGGSITYTDRTGKVVLWQDYAAVKRVPVQSTDISPYMKDATVAIEDKQFYHEGAFDVRGIMRAASHDALGGGGSIQGGSTITQQLVKLNENWTDNRTITRKVKELILSVELEREYSKDDILTGYLNIAPYGGVDYGVQSAAEDYFHTSAKDLTLAQAAMLAAIPQAPSYYSPYGSTEFNADAGNTFSQGALIGRQQYILDQMATQGYITQAQANAAKQVNVLAQVQPLEGKYQGIKAPYFVLAAKNQLEQQYGASIVEHGGWTVTTSLDMKLQNDAEGLVQKNLSNVEARTGGLADEEATVLESVPTGQIEALVGGVNFNNPDYGKINYADSTLVAPGSTFKPYDYVTLLNDNNNVGAGSVMYDSESPLPGYPCTDHTLPAPKGTGNCLMDYDFKQPGPITLRYALGGSRNIPAEKAMMEAVPNDHSPSYVDSDNKVISTASALMDNAYLESKHQQAYNCYQQGVDINDAGPNDETQCYNSAAIGDGAFLHLDDHINGLSSIAREGQAIPRTFILKIVDSANKTVYQWKQPTPTQAVKTDAAYILDNMASDPRASYLPGSCTTTNCTPLSENGYKFQRDNGWDFAVKTGTTNSGFDGLMASWSTQFAVLSWVGNHTRNVDITSRTGTSMEYLTEPLTRGLMEEAHAGVKPVNWTQPKDIKVLPAYVQRQHIDFGDIEPSPTKDIFPSWYVGGSSSGTGSATTIDRVSNLTATSCTPAAARETVYNSNVASWNVDIFKGGHASVGSSVASSSSATTSTDNVHNCSDTPPTITLTLPGDCTGSCTITATITQGTHPLSDPQFPSFPGTVTFKLNGQTIHTSSVSNSPSTVSFTYTPTTTGTGTISANVTDSVLYSGSDSGSLSYSAAAATPLTITSPTAGSFTGASVPVSWTGGTGTFSVAVNGNPAGNCQSVSTDSCASIALTSLGSNTIELTDSGGDSTSINVTRIH